MTYGNKVLDLSGGFEIEFKNVSFKYPGAEIMLSKMLISKSKTASI